MLNKDSLNKHTDSLNLRFGQVQQKPILIAWWVISAEELGWKFTFIFLLFFYQYT